MLGTTLVLTGCAASAALARDDMPTPVLLGRAVEAVPLRIARASMDGGIAVRTSEWMPYVGAVGRGPSDDRVFDCFGDSDGDGFMDDEGGCGLGASRYYGGTGYCNGMFTNDMTLHPDTRLSAGLGRVDLAWYWSCLCPPNEIRAEDCQIAVFTQESSPVECEPDSFDYSGWIFDFGPLSCNSGSFYYVNIDLGGETWPAPTDGTGSYVVQFLTQDGLALATCAQPMLWGTGDAAGGDPDNPGTQEREQLDDDNPLDGVHTVPLECYTYDAGLCPDPLGGMAQFWGELAGGCDLVDCDSNGVLDARDFVCFLNAWTARDPDADCDGNGIVDSRDVSCFLNAWSSCRP